MSRWNSRVLDYTVYLVVRFVMCVVQMLTPETARQLAAGLGWLIYHVDKRHRLVAEENLRHAFGAGYDDQQRDQVIRAIYQHLCTLFIEFLFMQRKLHVYNYRQNIDLTSARLMADLLLSDRPTILITGHFGNWELGSCAKGVLGFRTHVVARALDNPYLDRLLRGLRESRGQRVLDKNEDYAEIQKVLEEGGVLGTLADQDAGQRGVFVDFFGRPASTHKAIALLGLNYNARMAVAVAVKRGYPGKYDIVIEELIDPLDYADRPDPVRAITQRYTTALERLIRTAPEQYFWVHRRWKHQPKARKAAKPAKLAA